MTRARITHRRNRSRRSRSAAPGFTLLELIVAASVLALMAVFAWRGLDTLVREREALTLAQDGVDGFQRCFARLERDAMLARDAELDGSGGLRLKTADAAVEYRLVGSDLVRIVSGVDAAPVVLQAKLVRVAIEAWVPDGKSGWVKSRSATDSESAAKNAASQNAAASSPGTALNAAAGTQASPNAGTQAVAATTAPNVGGTPQAPAAGWLTALARAPVNATGIRITLGLADGSEVQRVFLLGSGA